MRLALTAQGTSLDHQLDLRFGRAPFVLIADTETGEVEAIDNHENMNAAEGAGIGAAQMVIDKQVEWLVTGHVGPKAYRVLQQAGIKVCPQTGGTCSEALERFRSGEIEQLEDPNVKGYW